jgi:Domain of unknown function (DUF5659)
MNTIRGDLINTDEGIKTCDLYLAAFFVSVGCNVTKTSREGKKVYFLFDKSELIEQLKMDYFTRQAKVDALTYADNIKSLKSLCASIINQVPPRA